MIQELIADLKSFLDDDFKNERKCILENIAEYSESYNNGRWFELCTVEQALRKILLKHAK